MADNVLSELLPLAEAMASAHRALVERVRALGEAHGVEILEARPLGTDGTWEVRVQVRLPWVPDASPATLEVRPPRPFMSPLPHSRPFDGDGTDDIVRFIAEADPAARVPGRGSGQPSPPLPRLAEGERLRMLAGTIAGDLLLALIHEGRQRDPSAVEGALRQARIQYAAELERAGSLEAPSLVALLERRAAELRHQLGTV